MHTARNLFENTVIRRAFRRKKDEASRKFRMLRGLVVDKGRLALWNSKVDDTDMDWVMSCDGE
jgi:hypothetical protein